MKTANKSTLACIYIRARAHARTPLHTLACAWMVLIALVIGAGDAWGQVRYPVTSTSEQQWNVPQGVTEVKINAIGGGAGGGNASGCHDAKGGGGGAYDGVVQSVTYGDYFTAKAGAGVGAASNGNASTVSFFNSSTSTTTQDFVKANGGKANGGGGDKNTAHTLSIQGGAGRSGGNDKGGAGGGAAGLIKRKILPC